MKKLLSISIVFIVFLTASKCNDQKVTRMDQAKIIYSGSIAADGCGWLLEIKGKEYSPVNLEESFQIEEIKVNVELTYLETGLQCGMNPDFKIPQVKIISMTHLGE